MRGRVTALRAFFVRSRVSRPAPRDRAVGAPRSRPRARRGGPTSRSAGTQPDYADRCASRSSTTPRAQRLRPRGRPGDPPRDPALPRAGERLERHRLQLPRRPLRDGLRGTLRRARPRTSSARTRSGSTPARSASRCSGELRAADRRRPPSKSARALSPGVSTWPRRPARDARPCLRRQRALHPRRPGAPARGLRPSRHRPHRLPGAALYAGSAGDRGAAAALGLPKLYEPSATRERGGGCGSGRALELTAWTRRRDGRGRRPARHGERAPSTTSTGPGGRRRPIPAGHAVADRGAGRHAQRRHAGTRANARARDRRPRRRAPARSRQTATGRRTPRRHVHVERARARRADVARRGRSTDRRAAPPRWRPAGEHA